MPKHNLKSGQKLILEPSEYSRELTVKEVTVDKVGNKYFTLVEYPRDKFSIDTFEEHSVYRYSNLSKCYLSLDSYNEMKEANQLKNTFREYFKSCSVDLTLNQLREIDAIIKGNNQSKFDESVFTPPFRLGAKQKRAILDAKGKEVVIFPENSEIQSQMYCDYLNSK